MYLIFSRLEKKLKQKLRSIALLWSEEEKQEMFLHTEWDEDKSIEELGTALGPVCLLFGGLRQSVKAQNMTSC